MPRYLMVPTDEERSKAREAFATAFPTTLAAGADGAPSNPMIEHLADIYALRRQYPKAGALLGKLRLEAPRGFGAIDVGTPNDGVHVHVLVDPEDFVALCERGEIVLNEQGYPDYIGKEPLR